MTPLPLETDLRIHLYTMSWNEEAMLGFFFRHYDRWVSRYVVYDDGSTDRTLELLAAHPRVEVRRFQREVPDSFVRSAQALHNAVWEESRGAVDWVIMTAVDEHLHHPDLPRWLAARQAEGVTAIPALGYEMAALGFPSPDARLAETVTTGAVARAMSKLSLFRPDGLKRTNFSPGRHRARPVGRVVYPARDELLLLHYKFLGDGYATQRQQLLASGLGALDRAGGAGRQYSATAAEIQRRVRGLLKKAVDVADPTRDHHTAHGEPRWWRPVVAEGPSAEGERAAG